VFWFVFADFGGFAEMRANLANALSHNVLARSSPQLPMKIGEIDTPADSKPCAEVLA
jgi:hypothetical protein